MSSTIDIPEVTRGKRQACYCERAGKRLEKQNKQLYLVLDGWSRGFNIHKIDDDTDANLMKQPGVVRIITPVAGRCMTFDAMGSHIFITTNPRCGQTPRLVYDTELAGLAIGPPLPESLLGDDHKSVATADMLYAFPHHIKDTQQFLKVMSWEPTDNIDPSAPRPTMDWCWQSVDSSWPFTDYEIITAYALHPDGHTIFFSAHNNIRRKPVCTFSFDTDQRRWRSHGEWSLPFDGQGYFDTMLDAWVGLNKDGYIFSCQVISCSSTSKSQPDCRMLEERLIRKNPNSRHPAPRATLTHSGGDNASFCLVECMVRDGDDTFGRNCCILRATTFGLRYSHKGELQTRNRISKEYIVSKSAPLFSPVAFWM